MPRTVTPEQAARMERMYPFYIRGETTAARIAEEAGVSDRTAARYMLMFMNGASLQDIIGTGPKLSTYEALRINRNHNSKHSKNKSLARLVVERLNESDITGAELARRIGVSREAVSRYAKGEVMPRRPVFERMCEVFGVSYETLNWHLREYYKTDA
jgi:DNA-binding XRE family transcriptional regulator